MRKKTDSAPYELTPYAKKSIAGFVALLALTAGTKAVVNEYQENNRESQTLPACKPDITDGSVVAKNNEGIEALVKNNIDKFKGLDDNSNITPIVDRIANSRGGPSISLGEEVQICEVQISEDIKTATVVRGE